MIQCEAGQYCTFLILNSGALYAMGKGSYGRLGLGDSTNHATPQRVRFKDETDSIKLKMVSSLINLYYILGLQKTVYVIHASHPM